MKTLKTYDIHYNQHDKIWEVVQLNFSNMLYYTVVYRSKYRYNAEQEWRIRSIHNIKCVNNEKSDWPEDEIFNQC